MICCAGKVLLTAMSVISSTLRPERHAAELICSRIREIFSEIDIEDFNHRGHRVSQRNNSKVLPPCSPVSSVVKILASYIIAVGGAGSLGSPAAEIGSRTISAANPASTTIPPIRYEGSL